MNGAAKASISVGTAFTLVIGVVSWVAAEYHDSVESRMERLEVRWYNSMHEMRTEMLEAQRVLTKIDRRLNRIEAKMGIGGG